MLQSLKKKSKRSLVFLFSIFVLFLIIGFAYYFQPKAQNFAKEKFIKKGINSDTTELSLLGKIHLKNIKFPLKKNIQIEAQEISGRIPLPFLAGHFTLKNVKIKYPFFTIRIPKITLNQISLSSQKFSFLSMMKLNLNDILKNLSVKSFQIPIANIEFENYIYTPIFFEKITGSDYENEILGNLKIQKIETSLRKEDGLTKKDFLNTSEISEIIQPKFHVLVDKININALNLKAIKNLSNYKKIKSSDCFFDKSITFSDEFSFSKMNLKDQIKNQDIFTINAFQTQNLKLKTKKKQLENLFRTLKKESPYKKDMIFLNLMQLIEHFQVNINLLKMTNGFGSLRLTGFQFNINNENSFIPENLHLNISGGFLNLSNFGNLTSELFASFLKETYQFSTSLDMDYQKEKNKLTINNFRFTLKNSFIIDLAAQLSNIYNNKNLDDTNFKEIFQNASLNSSRLFYNETGILNFLSEKFEENDIATKDESKEFFENLSKNLLYDLNSKEEKNTEKRKTLIKTFSSLFKNDSAFLLKINSLSKSGVPFSFLKNSENLTSSPFLEGVNISLEDVY